MIYICIPAYNEEQTAGVVLWKVRQVMADFPRDYQLLVADDASTDATADVLGPYTRVLPLTVFRNPQRRGYAAALEMLIREAVRRSPYPKRDAIVTLQADFTEDPEHIATLVKRIEAGADIVTSEISLPQQTERQVRWTRGVARFLARRGRWPEGVGDPLSGFRAYRVMGVRRALDAAEGNRLLTMDGCWAANAQLLRAVAPHARRIDAVELPLRSDRLQRESRLEAWPAMRQMLSFARGGAAAAPELPHEVDESMVLRPPAALRVEPAPTRDRTRRGPSQSRDRERPHRSTADSERRPARTNDKGNGNGNGRMKKARPVADAVATDAAVTGGAQAAPGGTQAARDGAQPAPDGAQAVAPAKRRRRRSRRRKSVGTQQELTLDGASAASEKEPNGGARDISSPGADTVEVGAGSGEVGEALDGAAPPKRRPRRRGGRRRGGRGRGGSTAASSESAAQQQDATLPGTSIEAPVQSPGGAS